MITSTCRARMGRGFVIAQVHVHYGHVSIVRDMHAILVDSTSMEDLSALGPRN